MKRNKLVDDAAVVVVQRDKAIVPRRAATVDILEQRLDTRFLKVHYLGVL